MDKCTFIIFSPLCPQPLTPPTKPLLSQQVPLPFSCPQKSMWTTVFNPSCPHERAGEGSFSKDNLPAPIPLRRVTAPSPGSSNSVLPETLLLVYRKILIDNFHGNIYDPAQN